MDAIPSLQWITKIPKSKRPAFDNITEKSIICADPTAWIDQLIPENKIELLGWKVEHTADSQFNLRATQNLQLSLTESEKSKIGLMLVQPFKMYMVKLII